MNADTFFYATGAMAAELRKFDAEPIRNQDPNGEKESHNHLLYMCEAAEAFYREGRREKAMRWLGFVQGYFWARFWLTIGELRKINNPRDELGELFRTIRHQAYQCAGLYLTDDQVIEILIDPKVSGIIREKTTGPELASAVTDFLAHAIVGRPWPTNDKWDEAWGSFERDLERLALEKGYNLRLSDEVHSAVRDTADSACRLRLTPFQVEELARKTDFEKAQASGLDDKGLADLLANHLANEILGRPWWTPPVVQDDFNQFMRQFREAAQKRGYTIAT
jgi:hypothetical protein